MIVQGSVLVMGGKHGGREGWREGGREVVDINYLDARRCVVSVHAWREQSCMV
jgi:hypothetical protein